MSVYSIHLLAILFLFHISGTCKEKDISLVFRGIFVIVHNEKSIRFKNENENP